jgi:hypothetical protein|tara:strand:+ start:410 stop:628 length:219 start_codon:yes stop_codon:yes gene_type:complete
VEEEVKHNPQKFKWNKVGIYSTYEDADEKRNALNEKGELTKIRRCGTGGSRFKVLTGESVEKPKPKKKEKKK